MFELTKKAFFEFQPSLDIYEFDLNLWNLFSRLCRTNIKEAADVFGLKIETIERITSAKNEDLHRLSSGVLISFNIENDECELLEILRKPYEQTIFLNSERSHEIESYFWSTVAFCGKIDVDLTMQVFALSKELVTEISNSSNCKLRHFISQTSLLFSIRFNEQTIHEILDSDNSAKLTLHKLKKIQQSLTLN